MVRHVHGQCRCSMLKHSVAGICTDTLPIATNFATLPAAASAELVCVNLGRINLGRTRRLVHCNRRSMAPPLRRPWTRRVTSSSGRTRQSRTARAGNLRLTAFRHRAPIRLKTRTSSLMIPSCCPCSCSPRTVLAHSRRQRRSELLGAWQSNPCPCVGTIPDAFYLLLPSFELCR